MAKSSHTPTPELRSLVTTLIACGMPHSAIRRVLEVQSGRPVASSSFYRLYRTEIAGGRELFEATMIGVITKAAMRGHVGSAMFMLKTRFGWRESAAVELTGPNGVPFEPREAGTQDAVQAVKALLDEAAAAKAAGAQESNAGRPDRVH